MRKKNVTLRNKEIQYLPILNQVALSDIHTMFPFPLTQGSNFSVLFPSLLLMLLSFTHSGVLVLISPIPQILTLPYPTCAKTTMPQHMAQTPSFVNSFLIPQMKMTPHSSELSYILQSDMKPPFVSCDRFMYTPFLHMSLSFSEIQL